METNRTQVQARGCFSFLDLLIFAFGAFIMFGKTANLLGKLAPDDWFGLTPQMYGLAAAMLIEGYLVAQKVKSWLIKPSNFMEWAVDIVVTIIPFGLSVFAQAADGWFTTGLIQNMSQQEKMWTTNVVSALVTVPIFLQIVQSAINNAPQGIFDDLKITVGDGAEFVGGFLRSVGKRFGIGQSVGKMDAAYAQTVDQTQLANQSVGKNVNPTKGKPQTK